MIRDRQQEFEPIFYPKSIAVVGSFSNPYKGGYMFLDTLLKFKFKGNTYAVSISDKEAFGRKTYRSLLEIPEPVDYVIVCVPAQSVSPLMDDCTAKGVKTVQIYTAGFSESGTEEGRLIEAEITRQARAGGFHIIGPNCVGVYNPSLNLPCGAAPFLGEKGDVGLLSQSGGNTERIIKAGMARKMGFSKAVSYGNGGDLDSTDYLEYFALDPETKVIGAYIEGVKDGRRFFNRLREITARKPVVLLKGGRTATGATTAASHTGSLATSYVTWNAAVRQANAIPVETTDEMADTLLALDRLPRCERASIALVSGLASGGGGDSVISADICLEAGLTIPPFNESTKQCLLGFLTWPGTITLNPLDLSGLGKLEFLAAAFEAIKDDPGFDIIVIQAHVDDICAYWTKKGLDTLIETMINFAYSGIKPLVVVLPPGLAEPERLEAEARLCGAGIAVYPDIERAAKAILHTCRYYANQRINWSSNPSLCYNQ